MRRMFPVNAGTVVVPYYPVKNDMILVQGDDEDSFWKAHVIKYNLKQKTLTVRVFVKRAGATYGFQRIHELKMFI